MMESEDCLITRWQDDICYLTLNRPNQGNALSADMVTRLDAGVADAVAKNGSKVVFTGAGKHFCTGFDLTDLASETDDSLLARFVRVELLLQRISHAPLATEVVGHGRVMGAGADLFAACQIRRIQGDTRFAFPGASGFGLVLGSRRLASVVGAAQALDWIESGRLVDSDEAIARGLVNVPDGEPAQASKTAVDLARPTSSLLGTGLAKQLRQAMQLGPAGDDALDLYMLVQSAAVPGLHQRICAYVQRLKDKR